MSASVRPVGALPRHDLVVYVPPWQVTVVHGTPAACPADPVIRDPSTVIVARLRWPAFATIPQVDDMQPRPAPPFRPAPLPHPGYDLHHAYPEETP